MVKVRFSLFSRLTVVHGNGPILSDYILSRGILFILPTGKRSILTTGNESPSLDRDQVQYRLFHNFNLVCHSPIMLMVDVTKMISFNRSPTWITPEFGEDMAPQGGGREAFYPNEEKLKMQDPKNRLQ